MATAMVSNTIVCKDLWVRLPPAAPEIARRLSNAELRGIAGTCQTPNQCSIWRANRSGMGHFDHPFLPMAAFGRKRKGELFGWACGLIGVDCRPNNRWNISVARRASVAILDEFIGPKS